MKYVGKVGCLVGAVLLSVVSASGADGLVNGVGPSIALVVNEDSWASKIVANAYVQLRDIPPGNVIYLRGVPGFETTDVDTFRSAILQPVLKAIDGRGLGDQIDYLVYSTDFPYAVNVKTDVQDRTLPKVITLTAAITGLTYLYQPVLARDPGYLSLQVNQYFRRQLPPPRDTAWTEAERNAFGLVNKQLAELQLQEQKIVGLRQTLATIDPAPEAIKKALEEAIAEHKEQEARVLPEVVATFPDLLAAHPLAAAVWYNLACAHARLGNAEQAVAALRGVTEAGWRNVGHIEQDKDFAALREREDFRAVLKAMRDVIFDVQPTVAFRGTNGWAADGQVVEPQQGMRYLLSTMLAVTAGRGLSVQEALENLTRSAGADGSRPAGTIYFMRNGDVRSTTRQWGFAAAVDKLKELGVNAAVIDGQLPQQKADVAGAMLGSAGFDWPGSGSSMLPGAICEHLTSTGGTLSYNGGQTPLTALLRAGAGGSSGTVTEPYAIQAKFPSPFIHVHYARGATLAEAFYQSVSGPYQLLVVGDPACRPWARIPEIRVQGIEAEATLRQNVRITPAGRVDGDEPVRRFEVFVDGVRKVALPAGSSWELPVDELASGWHELTVVGMTADLVRSRGAHRVAFEVAGGKRGDFAVTVPAKPVRLTGSVAVNVACRGAARIAVWHNGRIVGELNRDRGTVEFPASMVGLGRVTLQAVATGGTLGGERRARPVVLNVILPDPLPGDPGLSADAHVAKGLRLERANGAVAVVTQTTGNWLHAAGVKVGDAIVLEGVFKSPAKVGQLQIRGKLKGTVSVDGVPIPGYEPSGRWCYLPLPLADGLHRLRIEGKLVDQVLLDVRYGVAGTRPLDDQRFTCSGPPPPPPPPEPEPPAKDE